MKSRIEVIVTVGDAFMDDMESVAKRLRSTGLEVTNVLEITGQVIGTLANRTGLDAIRRVTGVDDAIESREITLPPPDSEVQ